MKVTIASYDPRWPATFAAEAAIIGEALQKFSPIIEHIGSTAVPGLAAKPIIDILVGVRDESELDHSIAPMIAKGYTYFKNYEDAMPYRRLYTRLVALDEKSPPQLLLPGEKFVRGEDFDSITHVHLLVHNTLHWKRHIAFRDYLRAHPEVRAAYAALKQELSAQEFTDGNAYNAAKNDFVKRVEAEALEWSTSSSQSQTPRESLS